MNTRRPQFGEDDFRKSSFSNPNQDCVEVAHRDSRVELRDSKTAFGTTSDQRIVLADEVFHAFLAVINQS
jgi:hypothetical protein